MGQDDETNSNSGEGTSADGPLKGIRVLDFTRAMAGPFGTMVLGDLGADIIKVEPPQGDDTRSWSPPEINGVSSYFMSANRNKRSICVDLKKEGALEIVDRLAEISDIVVENFRPGTADRLGIGYDRMNNINDRLIYCSISGFGQTGPYRDRPGFDLTILAASGLMGVTGEQGRPPVKFGTPITDITAGLFASISILSALHERDMSGKGQYIDTSMMDSSLLTLSHQATSFFATGIDPERMGSAHSSIAPYQAYRTSDGYVSVAVGSEKLWKSFCKALEIEDRISDPLLSGNRDRVINRDYLNSILEPRFLSLTTADAVALLELERIPVSPINKVSDLMDDPQVRDRKMITGMKHPVYGEYTSLGNPFRMSRTSGSLRLAPPLLGEHTMEVLGEAGFGEGRISELLSRGTVSVSR